MSFLCFSCVAGNIVRVIMSFRRRSVVLATMLTVTQGTRGMLFLEIHAYLTSKSPKSSYLWGGLISVIVVLPPAKTLLDSM